MDALVANGTIVQATVFNESCGMDVADNELLLDLEVDVRKSGVGVHCVEEETSCALWGMFLFLWCTCGGGAGPVIKVGVQQPRASHAPSST